MSNDNEQDDDLGAAKGISHGCAFMLLVFAFVLLGMYSCGRL